MTQVSTPISTTAENTAVVIPPGFAIPPSYIQSQANLTLASDPNSPSQQIYASAPLNPGVPPSSSVSVDISDSPNSTAHLFSAQPTTCCSPSKKIIRFHNNKRLRVFFLIIYLNIFNFSSRY